MAAVVLWQVNAAGLLVGGENDADTVENGMLAQMLFVDP
jgi:hypothetical protein